MSVIIPYRGDVATARLNYKKLKKRAMRKFKRHLLKAWNISSGITLWDRWSGYINDDAREALGIEENFLESTKNLTWFGVELQPTIDADSIANITEEQKEFLRDKALDIFKKYGKTIKSKYADAVSYDYQIFKDGVETVDFNAEDEELAELLYSRVIMYMIDNDSTDTKDTWQEHNAGEADFFNDSVVSKLKYFTMTFSDEAIIRVVNDRLFTLRNYATGRTDIDDSGNSSVTYTRTIDTQLFNELLDANGLDNVVDTNYWSWNGTTKKYDINYAAVKALPAEEFMIFIQTHLTTFSKSKKKWYQSGLFGVIVLIIAVVIAVYTGQWQLVGLVVSVSGAYLGNDIMRVGGMMIGLAGAAQSVGAEIALQDAALEQTTRELARAGMSEAVITSATQELATNAMIANLASVGKFALDAYSSFSSLIPTNQIMPEAKTPEEELKVIYMAEDEEWDFVSQSMPEAIIGGTINIA